MHFYINCPNIYILREFLNAKFLLPGFFVGPLSKLEVKFKWYILTHVHPWPLQAFYPGLVQRKNIPEWSPKSLQNLTTHEIRLYLLPQHLTNNKLKHFLNIKLYLVDKSDNNTLFQTKYVLMNLFLVCWINKIRNCHCSGLNLKLGFG